MTYNPSRALTLEEMTVNAQYILDYLLALGWTKNAICGMLGNMQSESTINPNRWQGDNDGDLSGGYGLVQWTPATKYIQWALDRGLTPSEMDSNLARILYEVELNTQWGTNENIGPPPYTFEQFTHSVESPFTLGVNFLLFYERPEVQNIPEQNERGNQATDWFNILVGGVIKKKSNIYMYLRSKKRIGRR